VHLDACGTQQLGTVETLGGSISVFPGEQFADVAERVLGRALATDQLRQTRHEEIIGEFLHSANRQLGALATQRARELAIVRISAVSQSSGDQFCQTL